MQIFSTCATTCGLGNTRLDAARVTLLEGINKLNKLILTKSKKFTLAVPSNVRFVIRAEF